MAGTILAATGLAAGATGIPQYFEGKKAARKSARAQEKANQVSQASAQVESARRRRRAIAQARVASATNQATMGDAVQSSSAMAGVNSAIGSQLGANIGAQQQSIGSQQRIQDLNQRSADALRAGQEKIGMWNAAGQTANLIMSAGTSFAGGPAGGGAQSSGAFVQPSARPTRPTF